MFTAKKLKKLAKKLGADLCGLAPADRFTDAPRGFHPRDIFPEVKTVFVLAIRFPSTALLATSAVPYTSACDIVLHQVLGLCVNLTHALEKFGIRAVPVPSEPYEFWDEENKRGMGILSLRHAAYLAGLGVLGKNTLLITPQYGNMVTLGALLLDRELAPDRPLTYCVCAENCGVCIQSCPAQALGGVSVNQMACRAHSQYITKKGYSLYTCSVCRTICPYKNGL